MPRAGLGAVLARTLYRTRDMTLAAPTGLDQLATAVVVVDAGLGGRNMYHSAENMF